MCRLLLVKSDREFAIADQLARFAHSAKHSKEFQGHGWGCAYRGNGSWQHYKSITPIWDDDFSRFGASKLLLAHARSAFKDEGIVVENNMPFYDSRHVFIFNGELRGVKIAEQGRIGAEKIFNFIKRFDHGSMLEALQRGTDLIRKRTKYVRAMNIIMADGQRAYLASIFNEDPDYFTLHYSQDEGRLIVASDPLPGDERWVKIANGTVRALP
jgi:predicted glutamine amidotransferase